MSRKRKRKKRKKRRTPGIRRSRDERRDAPSGDLSSALEKADRLIDHDRIDEAVELLESLLAAHPRKATLHYYLGYARAKGGDVWNALQGYERAQELSQTSDYWTPLASLYLEVELRAHALRAFRRALEGTPVSEFDEQIRKTIDLLEQDVSELARELEISPQRLEKGLYHMERGQIALHQGDFSASITASQKGIRILGDWLPPHNNLSMALFWDGQPEDAIAAARRVLSKDPDNVHALTNLIRYLTWTGREAEARELWPRLRDVTPQEHVKWIKVIEAAAILGEDEAAYRLLNDPPSGELSQHEQYYLAIAEANLGKRRSARRRLRRLQAIMPWADELIAALKAKRPGPGWAERYPYFHSIELVPNDELEAFAELISKQDDFSSRAFRRRVDRFTERYPQIVRMAEKLILEESQPDVGIAMLEAIANPAAYAVLRRFGLSQAGDDDTRMEALSKLLQAGEIKPGEPLLVWFDGEWREVFLRGCEVSDEAELPYAPQVVDALNEGTHASKQGDRARAERLFRRALKLEPQAKEAYNNLGAIYAQQDKHEKAREMFRQAVEIDPLYVFPRCNLAAYLLGEGDVEGAEAMLKPLNDVTKMHSQETAFYSYTQARILTHRGEYRSARRLLESALTILPGYEPAEDLIEWIDNVATAENRVTSFWEKQHERDLSKRRKLQAELSTPDPTLSEALPLYTKNALTGMGRVVLMYSGWTGLRKAELIEEIIEALTDPHSLLRIVDGLSDEEREGLRWVLTEGGHVAWDDFADRYDDDLDESRYWEWHTPETVMGRLRLRGLLVEATIDGEGLRIVAPSDLRPYLEGILGQ
jgi:tetratricopeptide (TPR) repeat protein